MLKYITLTFLLLSGQHQLLLLFKLQDLCTGISQQLNFSVFLLLMIITSVGFTICYCSVIHFFCTAITSPQHHPSPNHTLLPHPNLAFKTNHPNPLYHHHQWRTGGGVRVFKPPLKFRSFDNAAFDLKLRGKCLVFLFQHPN